MKKLIAYHGDQKLKDSAVAMAKEHIRLDLLVSGSYGHGPGTKACSVGCFYGGPNHKRSEEIYGIPESLTHLQDIIFEGLPSKKRSSWHIDFFSSAKKGRDLSKVSDKFVLWNLEKEIHFDQEKFPETEKVRIVILDLYKKKLSGKKIKKEEWENAYAAAANAYAAANAAAAAAAANAAYAAAANAAAAAAANAAYAAAANAAAAAAANAATYAYAANAYAKKEYFQRCAKKLLELMSEA